jgi:hypothetical protein
MKVHSFFILYYSQDEWLACQHSWLYLEPIFSAPDIRRQLPNESKMFLIVDKSFEEIMCKTAKVRMTLVCLYYNLVSSVASLRLITCINFAMDFNHCCCSCHVFVSL